MLAKTTSEHTLPLTSLPSHTSSACLHNSTSQQAHKQSHPILCGVPKSPGGRMGTSLGSRTTSPPHGIRLLLQLCSLGLCTRPAQSSSSRYQRKENREVKWFSTQASCWRQTLGRDQGRAGFSICHTSVLWRRAAGPWVLPPAGKSRGGGRRSREEGGLQSQPGTGTLPTSERISPRSTPRLAVPLLPQETPVSRRQDDISLPPERVSLPAARARHGKQHCVQQHAPKNVLLHWARGLPAACKHDW